MQKVFRDGEVDGAEAIDAISAIATPVVEMSFLQGLTNIISSAGYSKDIGNKAVSTLEQAVLNYGSAFVPTLLGQFARSVDDTRRDSYTGLPSGGISDTAMRTARKTMNKIPFLSKLSEPYINAYGEEEKQTGGNFLGRLAYNMFSPGYYSNTERDEFESELERLNDWARQNDEDSKLPKRPGRTYEGERLTPEQYTEYAKATGTNYTEMEKTLFGSDIYGNASDAKKYYLWDNIKKISSAEAKNEVFDKEDDGKAYNIYKEKGLEAAIDYLNIRYDAKEHSDGSSIKMDDTIAAISNSNLSDEEKGYNIKMSTSSASKDAVTMSEKYGDAGYYYWYSTMNGLSKKNDKLDAIENSDWPDNVKADMTALVDPKGTGRTKEKGETKNGSIPTVESNSGSSMAEQRQQGSRSSNSTIPTLDDASLDQKQIVNSSGNVNKNTAYNYLSNQGYSDAQIGETLHNTGNHSEKEQSAYKNYGYEGVALYYDIQANSDANNNGSVSKSEIRTYLKSKGYSDEEIDAWLVNGMGYTKP